MTKAEASVEELVGMIERGELRATQPDWMLHFDPKHLDDIRAVKGITANMQ